MIIRDMVNYLWTLPVGVFLIESSLMTNIQKQSIFSNKVLDLPALKNAL